MEKINLFISYSHQEKGQYLPELLTYLNEETCPKINIWYDERISPGNEWDDLIKKSLNGADIILLLISQSFLMSRYIRENELKTAMEKHLAGHCRVIPIFIRKCILDNYPQIRKLQGLPKEMNFISEMGEEKWGHYTDIVQKINDLAIEMETNRNVVLSSAHDDDDDRSGNARKIEHLQNNNKVFLSVPDSAEGRKRRKDFIIQVEGKVKYEGWPYEIVPGIRETEALYTQKEDEVMDALNALIRESVYTIHIITSEKDVTEGIGKAQYDLAKKYNAHLMPFKNIIWLLHAETKSLLDKQVSMNPIAAGNDYEHLFEIIESINTEKEKKITELKKTFSPGKKVFMFYDFSKDHNSDLRIKLKAKIEENENLVVRFSMPNAALEKDREDLDKCEGGFIFYGASDPQWFAMRQSILLDAGYTQSKAICIDEPEIEEKISRDVSRNAFITIKGKGGLDVGVKSFLEKLQNNL